MFVDRTAIIKMDSINKSEFILMLEVPVVGDRENESKRIRKNLVIYLT